MSSLLEKLKSIDWSFIRSSSINTVAFALGRVIGFAFTFIIARAYSSADLGYITYMITLGTIMAILVKPFHQHVITYFIGKYHKDEDKLESVMGNLWSITLFLFIGSAVVGVPILALLGRLDWNVLYIYAGVAVFYLYWGIATGYLYSERLMVVYVGSNVVQAFFVLIAVYMFNVNDTGPIIAIYGLSYFVPILLMSRFKPLNWYFHLRTQWSEIKRIMRFTVPVWASHVLYQVQQSAGIIILELFTTRSILGVYSLTATLVQVFGFMSQGITLVLMPRLAGMDTGRRSLVAIAITITLVANGFALIIYMALYQWFVVEFFGSEYYLNLTFGVLMAVSVILYSLHDVLTKTLVGIGKPAYETISRIGVAPTVLITSALLIPQMGAMGAAWGQTLGGVAGIIIYVILIVKDYRPKRKNSEI